MRARVDRERCVGHGRCYALAPVVYSDDDRGHCVAPAAEIPRELEAQARRGAESCPEHAISIESRTSDPGSSDRAREPSR